MWKTFTGFTQGCGKLFEILKKLADHPELRKQYGENARKRVLDNFTYDIFQENILKLVNSL